jgi:iron(III) transport system substrate-binding protein
LKRNGVRVVPGNSVVAERVARGELLAGVTDTDDFLAMQKQNPDIRVSTRLAVDNSTDSIAVPMTAALIKGAPHPEAARKLLDALSSEEIENLITTQMPGVYPTRKVAKTEINPMHCAH